MTDAATTADCQELLARFEVETLPRACRTTNRRCESDRGCRVLRPDRGSRIVDHGGVELSMTAAHTVTTSTTQRQR